MKIASAAAAAALIAQPALAAGFVNIWSTGFETGFFETVGPFPFSSLSVTFGGASFQSAGTGPGLGAQFFRNTTAGTTTFSAAGLGAHSSLKLSFDLVFVDSWDSINGSPAPDLLTVNVDGVSDNYTSANQSGTINYFGPGTPTAFGSYLGNPGFADRIVRYDFIIPHTASSVFLSLNAGGAGFQYGDDESWGIDNFSLLAATVPEPASWAMLIAGFGLVGAAARRRRVATAVA
jgi:hypothetical protein